MRNIISPFFAILGMLLCASTATHAQRQLNYIALDHTVLDFSSGAFKTSEIPQITNVSYRYQSTISTPSGQLALISLITYGPSSFSILDRTGNIMPHGAVFGIGDGECNLIVPNPCDTNIYYVFLQSEGPDPDKLTYCTVDLRQNGGLGDVVSGPTQILTRLLVDNIIAAPYGLGYWVIVHDYLPDPTQMSTDPTYGFSYFTFKVTADGVDPNPVQSVSHYSGPKGDDEWPSTISPDGKTILYPNAYLPRKGGLPGDHVGGELMSLDPATGKITHRQIIPSNSVNSPQFLNSAFSPDGKKLYISVDGPDYHGDMVQLDLSSGDSAAIVNSAVTIGANIMQRYIPAPDGKIYTYSNIADARGSTTYLGVIGSPNSAGIDCKFDSQFLDLGRDMWKAATVQEVSKFIPVSDANSRFWSARIINDSLNVTVHLPIYFHHSGTMSDVDMIMHYPIDGSVKYLNGISYNGKSIDVSGSEWPGRAQLHFAAADLNAAPDSLIGYANFLWTPFEYACDNILFDSLQTIEAPCTGSAQPFEGIIGSYKTCGASGVAESGINSEPPDFSIYPNPAKGKIEISITSSIGRFHYELFDALGKARKNGMTSDTSFQIEVPELAEGNYYLRIRGAEGVPVTKKVIILK